MLSYMRRSLLAPAFLLSVILATSADTPKTRPTPKQIARWIEQLGDNDFEVRENASKKLWQAGAAAESGLEKATKSDDPEVVRRSRDLLDKFRWGIYPDTPADIVALIHAYQSSAGKPRMEILQKLFDRGEAGLRAVLKIVRAEKDANQRKLLGDLIANKLPSAFLFAVTEGKYEYFEHFLDLCHESKFIGHNQYAAYYLLRGQLPERIAHFAARSNGHPEDPWIAQTLVYLHRANGDLAQALKAAQKCARPDLLESILYELGEWKALAARPLSTGLESTADEGTYHIPGLDNPAEKWAFRAAFARLAGKQKEFENAVRELRKFAEGKEERESRAFVAAKGLLLNDRPADGLELLRTIPDRRDVLFELLCARLEYKAALDLTAKEIPPKKETDSSNLYLARARLLCLLGDKEGEELFDRYAEGIKDQIDPHWVKSLLAEEMHAGLKDRAFAHAAKALNVGPPRNKRLFDGGSREQLYFAQLFPQQAKTAEIWWTVLRRQFKGEPSATVLKHLHQVLEGKVASRDVRAWIAADHGPPFVDSQLVVVPGLQDWDYALAEGAILAGLDDLASSLLKKADSRAAFLRLGDLLAAKKQWEKAAERYREAWSMQLRPEKPPDNQQPWQSAGAGSYDPLPLYLAGDALVRAGQEKEGKKLIEQAHWMPFADAATRYSFRRALMERGHKEAVRRETELLIRVSEPTSLYATEAIRFRAWTDLKRKDSLKAAEGLEQSMLNCLHSNTVYIVNANYCNVPGQIHQLRASGLLAEGKIDEALKHIQHAVTDSPGNVDLPIILVPELERHGRKKEATDLYNRCYGVFDKVCRDHPRCGWAHNSAAWMSACCRRNLDQALEHAQKAVELAPTHAGYLDTLAEVHFQRGDKDKAIALQKRAIQLDAKKVYFRKQLKRLEAGDPSAERPSENDED